MHVYINMGKMNTVLFITLTLLKLGEHSLKFARNQLSLFKEKSFFAKWVVIFWSLPEDAEPKGSERNQTNSGTMGPRMTLNRLTRSVLLIFLLNDVSHYHSWIHNVKIAIVELTDLI